RGAFSTGDRATIQDTASELWSRISPSNAMFLVTEPNGKVIASLSGKAPLALEKQLDVVREAAHSFPAQTSGFYSRNGELYHIAVTPVYVDGTRDPVLLNVLVTGIQVDALVAQDLKERTNSEFLFVSSGGVITSTLNPRATSAVVADLQRKPGAQLVNDGIMQYARFAETLTDINGKPVGEISILRSFEAAQKRIAGLTTNVVAA